MSETLKSIVAGATGLPSTTISISLRPPVDYQSNRLYDVWASNRHLIAKEFVKPDEFWDAPLREFRALKLLAPLDIAPQPVHFQWLTTPSLGPVVLYEFIEGEMWDRHCPTPTELAQLAEVWLKINSVPTENLWLSHAHDRSFLEVEARFRALFETYAAWAEAEFRPGRRAVDLCCVLVDSRRGVTRELADYDPPLCFCRADARFANVIQRPDGRLGLVDWEDSGLGDPAKALADIIAHPNQEDLVSPEGWWAFLQPYLAVRSESDPHLLRRMHLYSALYPLFWLTVLVRHGIRLADAEGLAGWHVNGLPANERLRRYLARGLAWPEMDFSSQMDRLAEVVFFPA